MRLKELHLVNFKNHRGADLVLGNQVNCFLGDNGSEDQRVGRRALLVLLQELFQPH